MSKILVVDDEEKVCWAFEQFFKEEGYTTVIASNAQEAIEKLTSEMPELVIMDIKMPGQMDGLDALAEMKRLDPDVYVIIMTAYGTNADSYKSNAVRCLRLYRQASRSGSGQVGYRKSLESTQTESRIGIPSLRGDG